MPATIISGTSTSFKPGFRPMPVILDKKSAEAYFAAFKLGNLKANELDALRKKAFDVKTNKTGQVLLRRTDGLVINSLLRKDEWEELDRAVVLAVSAELNGIQDLRDAGLVQRLGGIGTQLSQLNVASEKFEATVSMSGRRAGARDRVDKILRSFPVPIIHSEYEIGIRELDASRRFGDSLDTTEAMESGKSVAEKQEEMLFSGNSSIVLGGNTILGYTNHGDRLTDTATNYGGGDWGTAGNGAKTVLGMISALAAIYYRGPFGVYIANTQYFEAQTPNANRDGNDLVDIERIPQVKFVKRSDWLSDENVVVVQLTKDVVDLAEALPAQNREWNSGDDMAFYGKVLAASVPRLKSNYADALGVCHATGA